VTYVINAGRGTTTCRKRSENSCARRMARMIKRMTKKLKIPSVARGEGLCERSWENSSASSPRRYAFALGDCASTRNSNYLTLSAIQVDSPESSTSHLNCCKRMTKPSHVKMASWSNTSRSETPPNHISFARPTICATRKMSALFFRAAKRAFGNISVLRASLRLTRQPGQRTG